MLDKGRSPIPSGKANKQSSSIPGMSLFPVLHCPTYFISSLNPTYPFTPHKFCLFAKANATNGLVELLVPIVCYQPLWVISLLNSNLPYIFRGHHYYRLFPFPLYLSYHLVFCNFRPLPSPFIFLVQGFLPWLVWHSKFGEILIRIILFQWWQIWSILVTVKTAKERIWS